MTQQTLPAVLTNELLDTVLQRYPDFPTKFKDMLNKMRVTRVAFSSFKGYSVSTIHSQMAAYETMVLNREGHGIYEERYNTLKEAKIGHKRICKQFKGRNKE